MSMCLDKPGQRVLSSEHMGIMGYTSPHPHLPTPLPPPNQASGCCPVNTWASWGMLFVVLLVVLFVVL